MDADRRNDTGIFRYADVEYTPEGHTDAYRWDDFLGIAGGHVYSAMDTIDMVSTGGQYEGDEPEHAYACEIVGCCGLSDGVALFRPVSHDGADLIQIAFLRNEVDDATGAYTERFEAGSFDLPAADLPRSEFGVDLLEYFSGRSFKYTPGVSRGLDPREDFPRESIEQIVAQLIDDGDDFPVLFDGERVIEAFDGSPVHMSVPVEVDGEKVWTCGYDFCWGETVAPDFSRARGRFPDATVAAWAAERSVNGSDVNLGIKERML